MKLGRKAVKQDSRTLKMCRYFGDALGLPPAAVDYTRGIADWGVMLNDRLGDCTIAGAAHAVQVWSVNRGAEVTISDSMILSMYRQWDGYDPSNPATDRGGVELDVLNKWRKFGLDGHALTAFGEVQQTNLDHVRHAINLFGGIYIGVNLPLTAQRQSTWDLVSGTADAQAGSWGGHCVFVPKYDTHGFTCITWGKLVTMTNDFWRAYVDESYALLGNDWLGDKTAPNGLNLTQLQADLALIQ